MKQLFIAICLSLCFTKGSSDSCSELQQLCWAACGYPLVFPFNERCWTAYDGGVYQCYSPPGCTCHVPEHLRTMQQHFPRVTQCEQDSCANYDWSRLIHLSGSTKWCRACGYDCGGNRAACIANSKFCRSSSRCGSLNMCARWRESACRSAVYPNDTCAGVVPETAHPTTGATTLESTTTTVTYSTIEETTSRNTLPPVSGVDECFQGPFVAQLEEQYPTEMLALKQCVRTYSD